MILSQEKIMETFEKVKNLKEDYCTYSLSPNKNVISIKDLIDTVARMYNLSIETIAVEFPGKFTRGVLLRYRDKVIIPVRHNLENSWQNFTVVKEISHIILDQEEDWSFEGVKTITNLLDDYLLMDKSSNAKNISQSEFLAELAALEIMYPHDCRTHDLKKIKNNETSKFKIAIQHKIPEVMIVKALSERHIKLADSIWKKINGN